MVLILISTLMKGSVRHTSSQEHVQAAFASPTFSSVMERRKALQTTRETG